jgi:hypothetical protein
VTDGVDLASPDHAGSVAGDRGQEIVRKSAEHTTAASAR